VWIIAAEGKYMNRLRLLFVLLAILLIGSVVAGAGAQPANCFAPIIFGI
jgi:hypothetical protein